MDIRFADKALQALESGKSGGKHSGEVIRGFRKAIRFIRSANDERDFWAMRSLRFEKLKGNRAHQYSMRLNDQWRLILEIPKAEPKNTIVVVAIEDYH